MTLAVRTRASGARSGTKTFLFADLRGYTAFTEQHGDEAASEMIHAYQELMRDEIARAGGYEIAAEGDSFFVVFDGAGRALECALRIQRAAFERSSRRPDRPIRVGIGLHAGEPIVQQGDYLGLAANIAARLAQNAREGETLLSDVVRGLVPPAALPPITPREGLVLKGIDDTPRVYAIASRSITEPNP